MRMFKRAAVSAITAASILSAWGSSQTPVEAASASGPPVAFSVTAAGITAPRLVSTVTTPHGAHVKRYNLGGSNFITVASSDADATLESVNITDKGVGITAGSPVMTKAVAMARAVAAPISADMRMDIAQAVATPKTTAAEISNMADSPSAASGSMTPMSGATGGETEVTALTKTCYGFDVGYANGNACIYPNLVVNDGHGNWDVWEKLYATGLVGGFGTGGVRSMNNIQTWATHPPYNVIEDTSPAGSRPDTGAGCSTSTFELFKSPFGGLTFSNQTCNAYITPIPVYCANGACHWGVQWVGNFWVKPNYTYSVGGEDGVFSPSYAHYFGTTVSGWWG